MDQSNLKNDELAHFGVIGMKWGVRRAQYKLAQTDRLNRRIKKYEVSSAKYNKKSEKIHANEDLGRSNRAATRSANYTKKSAKLTLKAKNESNEMLKSLYEKKATSAALKAAKQKLKANRLSKTTGYSIKAMKYSNKSDKAAIKVEQTKKKLASNSVYVNRLKIKISKLDKDKQAEAKAYMKRYLGM